MVDKNPYTKSPFSGVFTRVIDEDAGDSFVRLQSKILSAISPVLGVFAGSRGSATIQWGQGTPTYNAPPGSVYFRTDVPTTNASNSLWVKQTPSTSTAWSTFALGSASGAAITTVISGGTSLLVNVFQANPFGATWSSRPVYQTWGGFVAGETGAGFVASYSGTLTAISINSLDTATNGGTNTNGCISSGSISLQAVKNGVGTALSCTLDSTTNSGRYVTFKTPVTFVAGDYICLYDTANAPVKVAGTYFQIQYSLWGQINGT